MRCKTSLRGAPSTQVSSLIPNRHQTGGMGVPPLQGQDKARRYKNPAEARIKDLVSAIIATQDKLLTSFEMHRDERMARMTAIQQGQYIIEQWYQKIMKKEENYISKI